MKYVYVLQSLSEPDRRYVGCTSNLKERFKAHNKGQSPHTAKYLPWTLVNYVAFSDHGKADEFELYLKSGSGRSFAKKHF